MEVAIYVTADPLVPGSVSDALDEVEGWAEEVGASIVETVVEDVLDADVPWVRRPAVARLLRTLAPGGAVVDAVVMAPGPPTLGHGDLPAVVAILGGLGVEVQLVGHGPVRGGLRSVRRLEQGLGGATNRSLPGHS